MAGAVVNNSGGTGSNEASLMGKRETADGKLHCCLYENCGATFKKLEHCQRHVRTHTLDRPYTCAHCSKSFARQDTLNRHVRLHTRKQEDGPTAKTGRKRKGSVSQSPANKVLDLPVNTNASSNASTLDAAADSVASKLDASSRNLQAAADAALTKHKSAQSVANGLPFSTWPVNPPNFPAYSKPYIGGDELMPFATAFSMQPPPMPQRRYSDITYANTMPTLQVLHPPKTRPRANTLAEQLGSFSLVNSPDSSGPHSSSDDEDEEDDVDSLGRDINRSKSASSASTDQPSSQYPSPAFTSYSPSDLSRGARTDLDAILANDMLHQNNPALFPTAPAHQEEGFDLDRFAASVEGPIAPSNSGLTLEDLFAARPMTPPQTEKQEPVTLSGQSPLDFDFQAAFAAADRDRLEKQAAQARPPEGIPLTGYAMHNGLSATAASLPTQAIHMPASPPPISHNLVARSYSSGTGLFPSNANDLASAYASSYPSLSTFPNGLGLSQSESSQAFLDAYRRTLVNSASSGTHGVRPGSVASTNGTSQAFSPTVAAPVASPTPAFYIPATSPPETVPGHAAAAIATPPSNGASMRLNLPVPPWHREARDGTEAREGFLVV